MLCSGLEGNYSLTYLDLKENGMHYQPVLSALYQSQAVANDTLTRTRDRRYLGGGGRRVRDDAREQRPGPALRALACTGRCIQRGATGYYKICTVACVGARSAP